MKRELPSYFFWLDVLRGAAILLVVLHHSPDIHWVNVLQENGRRGVSLFFVISGFLIATLFLREEDRTGTISLKAFYLRRAARLLPLYYLVLALECFLVFVIDAYAEENRVIFRNKLLSYVLFFSNWRLDAGQGPFFVAWSLAVEEQFYFLFSLAYIILRRASLLLALGLLLLKVWLFAIFGPELFQFWTWRVLFSYAEPIFYGVLLAFALHYGWIPSAILQRLSKPFGFGVFGAGMFTVMATHYFDHASAWYSQLLYLWMVLVVLCALVQEPAKNWIFRGLGLVGKVSYGIYLLHMFVLIALKKFPLPAEAVFLLAIGLSLGAALLSFHFFEQPIMRLARKQPPSRVS